MNSFEKNSLQQVTVPSSYVLLHQRLAIVDSSAVNLSCVELNFVSVRLQKSVRLFHDHASLQFPAVFVPNQLVLLLEQVVLLSNLFQHHLLVRTEVIFVDRLVVYHQLRDYLLPRRQVNRNAPNSIRNNRLLNSVRRAQPL